MARKIKLNPLIIIAALGFMAFFPRFVLADTPPPPPFTVYVNYEGQQVRDERFYAVLLICQKEGKESTLQGGWRSIDFQENFAELKKDGRQNTPEYKAYIQFNNIHENNVQHTCAWQAYYLPDAKFCLNSSCHFRYILGDYKMAVYLPSLDKLFISNEINRSSAGYYGSDTATQYRLELTAAGTAKISEANAKNNKPAADAPDQTTTARDFKTIVIASLIITLILELIAAFIFALIQKAPKRILLGVLIGNLISVPLLWLLVTRWYWTLFPAEILVVAFEAWIITLFSRGKLNWKMCLLISFIMNLISFIFGPIIYH